MSEPLERNEEEYQRILGVMTEGVMRGDYLRQTLPKTRGEAMLKTCKRAECCHTCAYQVRVGGLWHQPAPGPDPGFRNVPPPLEPATFACAYFFAATLDGRRTEGDGGVGGVVERERLAGEVPVVAVLGESGHGRCTDWARRVGLARGGQA